MRRAVHVIVFLFLTTSALGIPAYAASSNFTVAPVVDFDPYKTGLVQAAWLTGIGCPTNATIRPFLPDGSVGPATPYADPACAVGDPKDKKNEGLLLVKTGPTNNFAAAAAVLNGVKGTVLSELGYDIRKPGPTTGDARGSHCGGGAPRFNVQTTGGRFFFIGCNSAPAAQQVDGTGFIRLRWGGATSDIQAFEPSTNTFVNIFNFVVEGITIIFDEGQDVPGGPDEFGLAVLDNIDVNGTLVGKGPTSP
jgi:hypothetical protein